MANKVVAVFLMCIVVVAALHFTTAKADATEAKFKSCFQTCHRECTGEANGLSFCEVKCDEDCSEKEAAEKLHINLAH